MALKVGISVVSLSRQGTLRRTLEVLEKTAAGCPVVIVDNGSDEPTLNMISKFQTRLGWFSIRNGRNLGLSAAVNQGLAWLFEQECDLLVHLDDDAVIDAPGDWPRALGVTFDSVPELGLLAPNGRAQYVEFIAHPQYDELRWTLGYIWALRADAYEKVGGYDTVLLHQQECDIALRVRMAGFTVGSHGGWKATHNDPGGERSDLSKAREHLGIVQFRDKWASYFRGTDWNYGTMPLYLMQHWPPDQEWYRRFGLFHNLNFNPPPEGAEANTSEWALGGPHYPVGSVNGLTAEQLTKMNRIIKVGGMNYMLQLQLVNDHAYWERGDAYLRDRQAAIDRWKELTGEEWEGYPWGDILARGCR